jgi:hypothetical protein
LIFFFASSRDAFAYRSFRHGDFAQRTQIRTQVRVRTSTRSSKSSFDLTARRRHNFMTTANTQSKAERARLESSTFYIAQSLSCIRIIPQRLCIPAAAVQRLAL